jgi:hypothetical protein
VGLGLLVYGGLELWRYRVSRKWPSTTADIRDQRFGIAPGTVTGSVPPMRSAVVDFEYVVNDQKFRGTVKPFRLFAPASEEISELSAAFPVDARVTVRYDPARPERSYVDRNILGSAVLYFVCGVCLLIISALVLWGAQSHG